MASWSKLIAAVAAALVAGAAQAAYILDTGPGTGNTLVSLYAQGVAYQNLGVSFNVGQSSSISSVEGWIGGTGSVLFQLHAGATPNGAVLFSSLVALPGTADGWQGATGLDWDVAAGDYTLTVIAQAGASAWMADTPSSPAGTEWFQNALTPNWSILGYNVGWRVGASENAVPEPGTAMLLALGLVAALTAARSRPSSPARRT